jgi:toxin-antitoxin system PIN domain toxin
VRCLLDVNILIALAFPVHSSHKKAYDWFRGVPDRTWSTCPITQAGFLRHTTRTLGSSHKAFRLALAGLEQDCQSPNHEFWPVDIDLRDLSDAMRRRVLGPNQVTDLQLLLLAHKHGGQLATFDTGIRELATGTRYANSVIQL